MVKVAAHAEGKTLHEKLRELGATGIQGPVFSNYNYETGGTTPVCMIRRSLRNRWWPRVALRDPTWSTRRVRTSTHRPARSIIQKHPWSLFSDYWELMKLLIRHILDKGERLVGYYGWYSSRCKGERRRMLEELEV